ncbi:MAG: hypothetical protein AAF384_08625 [Pseudomonadota bacterium]
MSANKEGTVEECLSTDSYVVRVYRRTESGDPEVGIVENTTQDSSLAFRSTQELLALLKKLNGEDA